MASYCEIAKNPMQSKYIEDSNYNIAPHIVNKTTLKTEHIRHVGYVHYFRTNSWEIPCMNLMHSYKFTVKSDKICTAVAYTTSNQTTMYTASDLYNKHIVLSVNKHSTSFYVNFKRLALVSNIDCNLEITITPVKYIDSYRNLDYNLIDTHDGHIAIMLPFNLTTATSFPLHRMLWPRTFTPPDVKYSNIKYSLNTSSALTITNDVDSNARYYPYSIKLPQLDGLVCKLKYKITIKASDALTVVTAIESLSHNSYSILKDIKGHAITNSHSSNVLEGEMILMPLPVDVGLHIYTPYGFSGTLGDDNDHTLVVVNKFVISYS